MSVRSAGVTAAGQPLVPSTPTPEHAAARDRAGASPEDTQPAAAPAGAPLPPADPAHHAELGREGDAGPTGAPGPADAAELGTAVLDELEAELAEVEAALARLDDGSYGRCTTCGGPIDDEWLAQAPAIRHCRDHLPLVGD